MYESFSLCTFCLIQLYLLVPSTENHLSSFKCGFLNIFSRQNVLRSLSSLLFSPRWNKIGAKKCLTNHIPFDFWDDSTPANQGARKTMEKPLKELPWNQQIWKWGNSSSSQPAFFVCLLKYFSLEVGDSTNGLILYLWWIENVSINTNWTFSSKLRFLKSLGTLKETELFSAICIFHLRRKQKHDLEPIPVLSVSIETKVRRI